MVYQKQLSILHTGFDKIGETSALDGSQEGSKRMQQNSGPLGGDSAHENANANALGGDNGNSDIELEALISPLLLMDGGPRHSEQRRGEHPRRDPGHAATAQYYRLVQDSWFLQAARLLLERSKGRFRSLHARAVPMYLR